MKQGTFLIAWSEEDGVFVARHSEFRLLATHGDSPEAALREIVPLVVECRHAQQAMDREEGNND